MLGGDAADARGCAGRDDRLTQQAVPEWPAVADPEVGSSKETFDHDI